MRKSLLPYILVGAIGVTAGVGVTAVVEDAMGLPFQQVDYNLFDPDNVNLEALISMLADHPEWANTIFDWIKEHPDVLEGLDASSLADMIQEHPELAEDILKNLAEDMSLEELEALLNDPSMAELLAENPELAALAAGFLISQMGSLDFSPEAPEPSVANSGSVNNALGGVGSSGSIDDGSLDPSKYNKTLFSFDSDFAGTLYLRSASRGDYSSSSRSFLAAPEFDPSTYFVSPLLFTGAALRQSYNAPRSATLNMHMGSFRDEGMIVGDYVDFNYSLNGRATKFSRLYENRLGRIDESEYTLTCFPSANLSSGSYVVPTVLSEEESRYYDWVKKNYTAVPDSIRDELRFYLDNHGLHTPSDVESYLKNNYKYQVGKFNCPEGQDIVVTFLNESTGGTCTNFASAMTLLSRTLGWPARFVTGYMLKSKVGANDVLGNMGHAWTEVYAPGIGWQRFDATAPIDNRPDPNLEVEEGDPGIYDYDMAELGNVANKQLAFFTKASSNQEIFLKSRAYDVYSYAEHKFLPLESKQEDVAWMLSAAFRSHAMELGEPAEISFTYLDDYVSPGNLVPEPVVEREYSADGATKTLEEADDSRFYRDNATEVSFVFYPNAHIDRTKSYTPTDAQVEYLEKLKESSYYSGYPEEYVPLFASLCDSLGIDRSNRPSPETINSLINKYIFSKVYDGFQGNDPISYLLSSASKHMGRYNAVAGMETLLLRYLGYRARFVDGFRKKLDSSVGGLYLNNQDAYAWVEVFDEDYYCWDSLDPNLEQRKTMSPSYHFENEVVDYSGGNVAPSQETAVLDMSYNGQKLYEGDYIEWAFKDASTISGSGSTRIRPDLERTVVRNIFGDDVSEYYYLLVSNAGKLTVNPINLSITWQTKEVPIGYNPSTSSDKPSYSVEGLAPGDHISATFPDVTYLEAGSYDFAPSIKIYNEAGKDVTNAYIIESNLVVLTVKSGG